MVLENLNSPPLGTSASHQNPATTKENLLPCRITNSGTGRSAHTDHKQQAPRAIPGFQSSFLTRLKVSDYTNNQRKLDHQLVSKENKINVEQWKDDKDRVTITVKTNPL